MPEPTAQVEMTPPVDVLPKKSTEKCCGDKNCDTCLKGGMPMKKELLSFLVIIMVGLSTLFFTLWVVEMRKSDASGMNLPVAGSMEEKELAAALFVMPEPIPAVGTVALPKPDTKGELSVEEALASRRSIRTFEETPVSLSDVSQMLWAGQGVTDDSGHRTAPSARGLYPHTLYVIVRNVDGVKPGLLLIMVSLKASRNGLWSITSRSAPPTVNTPFAGCLTRFEKRFLHHLKIKKNCGPSLRFRPDD